MQTARAWKGGYEVWQPRKSWNLKENTNFLDTVMSVVLHDLPFNQNQKLRWTDD